MKAPTATIAAALALLAATASSARAQPHERAFGIYVVRASVVPSTAIAARQARQRGIRVAPNVGVLNVVVLRRSGKPRTTERAAVTASVRTLYGTEAPIPMRAAAENDRVSYLGTFRIPGRGADLEFRIAVRPEKARTTREIRFKDHLGLGRR
jgi:hypothetical protein